MNGIDPVFFDKKFSASRYMLRYVVAASTDEIRQEQLQRVQGFRAIADKEIAGVIDENFTNFNTSLVRFTSISNQLQDTRDKLEEVSKRSTDGKNILSSKTKNLRELLLHKYEAQKVITVINDIQFIEAAPAKIQALMDERNYQGAVDMFSHSLDLVFSENLVAFHAITGIRNALMECKQTIEDRLVHELKHLIYMKGAFENFARANQYSLASIEHELSNDAFLDNEFDKQMYQSNQRDCEQDRLVFADSTSATSNQVTANPLLAAVNAVKKFHREMEVIGTLKTTIESEVQDVVLEISRICRGIFNSSSQTSFDNNFTEKTFGKHDHSANFHTFLRLLLHVVRRIAQRHYLVSVYFTSQGETWNYGMQEVIAKLSGLVERILSEYFEDAAVPESLAVKDAKAAISEGNLFRLSQNKEPSVEASGVALFGLGGKGSAEATRARVCDPSVFHLPVVYEDLGRLARDFEQFFHSSTSSGFASFINQFIAQKWIPKVKAKAQQFLVLKHRNMSSACRLPIPSDTSYQPPSIESLLYIAEEICEMIGKMPDHLLGLVSVLDATVLKWLEDCTTIVRDIREPTRNHKQMLQNVAFSDLIALFQQYEGYQKAKRSVPIPYQHSKVQPLSGSAPSSTYAASSGEKESPGAIIMQKELELESAYYDPDSWTDGAKGLLMDNSRIAMLGYINSACDYIAQYLQNEAIKRPKAKRDSSFGRHAPRNMAPLALQATSWRCSALADECLLFLRREIRLHSFYFLTQLTSQRFDMAEELATMAHDSVLSLNINLSSIENALQPYLTSDKMALAFDGIDALLANILISNLQQMNGATLTKGGIQQMLLNIGALHQGLTGILYSYPTIGRTGYHFEHAKRYYQLLSLAETQLEVFLLDNRKAYTPEAFKALWRVETPHRVLSKGSVNKLDSILR